MSNVNWNNLDKKLNFCVRNKHSLKISWCERVAFGSTLFDHDGVSVGHFIHNLDVFDIIDARGEDSIDYQAELDKKEMIIWDLELQISTLKGSLAAQDEELIALKSKLTAYEEKDKLQRKEACEYAQLVTFSEDEHNA